MKKAVPFLFLILLQGCLVWSRQWDLGMCRELSPGHYSCTLKIPKSSEVVSVGVKIFYKTEKHVQAKKLRIRIENEESHTIQIQGISPFVLLKPNETTEFDVKVGPATKGVDGAYICAFNTAVRVKFDIYGENLDGSTIRIKGLGGGGL